MSTTIRAELSERNKYWIEKHRYYELKHFCLQYPLWRKARTALDSLSKRPNDSAVVSKTNKISSPVEKCVEAKLFYTDRMELLENVASETDEVMGGYILKAVTEGVSYDYLKVRMNVPCCKDTYYELYRRFFWLLNKARG